MQTIPRTIAECNPLSAMVAAVRLVTQGTASTGSWPLEHPIPATVAYCIVVIAICLPLAVRQFRKAGA